MGRSPAEGPGASVLAYWPPSPLDRFRSFNPVGTGLLGLVHPKPSLPCGHVPVGARVNICWMK